MQSGTRTRCSPEPPPGPESPGVRRAARPAPVAPFRGCGAGRRGPLVRPTGNCRGRWFSSSRPGALRTRRGIARSRLWRRGKSKPRVVLLGFSRLGARWLMVGSCLSSGSLGQAGAVSLSSSLCLAVALHVW